MSAIATEELKKLAVQHPRFKHEVLPSEVESAVPETTVRKYYDAISDAIALEENDPLRYGFEPEIWKKADDELAKFREENPVGVLIFVVLGGIRSSKTEWRSKRTVEAMVQTKDYKVWASHSTQESSREAQQSKINRYIPPEYKSEKGRMRIGTTLKVNYTPWGGFTEDTFAIPSNAGGVSECRFKFYSMNPRSLEGAEINEGWLDEQAGMEWLNAYIGRCSTRNGVVFLTFAAIDGYTPLVKSLLTGAETLEWCEAPLVEVAPGVDPKLPFDKGGRMVPRVQQNLQTMISSGEDGAMRLKAKTRIVYFYSSDNPYGNPASLQETLSGASREKILMMYYGVPTKAIASQFNFSESIHVMKQETYRALLAKLGPSTGTRYLLIDPCPGRNWFMLWVWFWAPKRAIVYREWPSHSHPGSHIEGIGDPGPWAVPGKSFDGEKGEAQRPMRFGFERYVEEIAKAEGWWDGALESSVASMRNRTNRTHGTYEGKEPERITIRLVDGRYAVSPTQVREGATTWIEQMSDLGLDFVAMAGERKILSGESDGSIEMINRALSYDDKTPIGEFSPSLARINEPELYVLETCPNLKFALENWTGRDGGHGACKDPVDCLRGIYLSELDYQDPESFRVRVHGHFQR